MPSSSGISLIHDIHNKFAVVALLSVSLAITKLVLIQLLIMAFAVIGIIVTPGGTDYNGSKNAIIAAAVKDSKADTNRLFAY